MNKNISTSSEIYKPFLVQDQDTLNQILYKLRIETWLPMGVFKEGELKPEDFVDEHENHAYHWAIKKDNRVIAAARMCVHNSLADIPDANLFKNINKELKIPIASFNRLVVTPDFQKNGLSKLLDHIRVQKALELKCKTIVIHVSNNIRIKPLLEQQFEILGSFNEKSGHSWLDNITSKFGQTILVKEM
jgi:GNAT superfamily N-acetyltransferase